MELCNQQRTRIKNIMLLNQSHPSKRVMDEIIEIDSEKAINGAKVTDSQGKGKHGKSPISPTFSHALVSPYV